MNNDALMLGNFKNTFLPLIKVSSSKPFNYRLTRPKPVSSIIHHKFQSCKHEDNALSSAVSYGSKAKKSEVHQGKSWSF